MCLPIDHILGASSPIHRPPLRMAGRPSPSPDQVEPMPTIFDTIDRLKAEWTDKYVVVDSAVPELARFAATTGVVKTVNMNGRCLVEFDQFNNIGWYDIDPSALRIVTEPLPKPAAKPAAKDASATSTAKPVAKPAAKQAAAKPAATPAAKPAGGAARPSTADILAMARGAKAAAAKPAAPPVVETEAPVETAAETVAEPPAAPAPEAKVSPASPKACGPLPTTTAEKIAWCRTHDAKG
jgi:hypothetical protein